MDTIGVKEISTQHFEHKIWMKQLNFFRDELKIYEHQLEDLVGKTAKDMLPKLEHFQNSFLRQREVLKKMRHEIKNHEREIAAAFQADQELSYPSHIAHEEFREEMKTFEKLYKELKEEFLTFWKKWH